jgi:hypothetical protein
MPLAPQQRRSKQAASRPASMFPRNHRVAQTNLVDGRSMTQDIMDLKTLAAERFDLARLRS